MFYIANSLFYDENAYYCFQEIEHQRERLLRATKTLQVTDFGTGVCGERKVNRIARTSLASRREGQILFRLVEYLRPKVVVELGTSLGITTAYMASAMPEIVHTFEGSEAIAEVARDVWKRLHLSNITSYVGNIDETLDNVLAELDTIDVAFLDANHTEEATMRYFAQIVAKCTAQSVVVLDDIHYSRGMERAWKAIQQDERVSCTMDLYYFGIVFFNKQYLHKHYKLNV